MSNAQIFVQELIASVKDYSKILLESPDAKNRSLQLGPELYALSPPELTSALRSCWAKDWDLFERFSFAKHALILCTESDCLLDMKDLVPAWLRACVEVGGYEDSITFSDAYLESAGWNDQIDPRQLLSLLMKRAKSFRSLGRFNDAQRCYREAINIASELNIQIEVSIGLLLLGKLFGNYLGQRSLFSSFVEEAKARLQSEVKHFSGSEAGRRRLIRSLAICHDALGQAYRDTEQANVEKHFQKAIKLNKQIGNANGVSRAICHLNYFRFKTATATDKAVFLEGFREGLALLMGEPPDVKGLGVRMVQYASMLQTINETDTAKQFLASGKKIATDFSEYKTLTRAALVESAFYIDSDNQRAIRILKDARTLSRQFNLLIQESEINRRLAELLSIDVSGRLSDSETQLPELFNRNREIFVSLISEVKGSLVQFDSEDNLSPEFRRLSRKTRRSFRERLLLDFEHTVKQLDLNISAMTQALNFNERYVQELLVFQVVNSVARLLLHEYKTVILADTTISPLQDLAGDLDNITVQLRAVKRSLGPANKEGKKIEEIARSLSDGAESMYTLAKELGRLRTLLSERLRRPRHLEDQVSLRAVCNKAIDEIKLQVPRARDFLKFVPTCCDVMVRFNADIMIVVIQNLIRNAIEGMEPEMSGNERIIVSLDWRAIGDLSLANKSKAATLSVMTYVGHESRVKELASAIENALVGGITSKPFGAGVGFDLANLVFRDLLGANIHAISDKDSLGVQVSFKSGTDRVKVIMDYKTD